MPSVSAPERTATDRIPAAEMPAVPKSRSHSRPLLRRLMHFIRRTHLYIGLFLFPWAILYGITGFLFNHPNVLPDTPVISFSKSDLAGTSFENWPQLEDQARDIVAALNELKQPSSPFKRAEGAARYSNRDAFNITSKADQRTFFITFSPTSFSGVIREATAPKPVQAPAPFATGKGETPRQRGMGTAGPAHHDHSGVKIVDSLIDRLKSGVPELLKRKGLPAGEITITNSPDIKFPIEADGQIWTASFNPLSSSVSGSRAGEKTEMSWRIFLLRMHLTRGYPAEFNTKWVWAMGVDAIALTLCFWGVSGLFMWWQIKATRKTGLVILGLSAILATTLGFAMHALLTS